MYNILFLKAMLGDNLDGQWVRKRDKCLISCKKISDLEISLKFSSSNTTSTHKIHGQTIIWDETIKGTYNSMSGGSIKWSDGNEWFKGGN